MSRYCQCGCGKPIPKRANGVTDVKRRFATRDCLATDKRERMREQRSIAKGQKPRVKSFL